MEKNNNIFESFHLQLLPSLQKQNKKETLISSRLIVGKLVLIQDTERPCNFSRKEGKKEEEVRHSFMWKQSEAAAGVTAAWTSKGEVVRCPSHASTLPRNIK